jgi:hypothetical protein
MITLDTLLTLLINIQNKTYRLIHVVLSIQSLKCSMSILRGGEGGLGPLSNKIFQIDSKIPGMALKIEEMLYFRMYPLPFSKILDTPQ